MSDRDVVLQRIAANLRRARRLADLSQESLGLKAGLHRTEIGMLENAERLPRIDTVVKLATALEIPVDQLIDGVTWELPQRIGEPGRFQVSGFPSSGSRPRR